MAATIQKIQFKRGTKINLELVLKGANKPSAGEPVWESDTNKLKIGDGINDYSALPYVCGDGTQQIVFGTHYEFPAVGEENKLYIAKDELNSYIWTGLKYEIISVDGRELDGGNANTVF